MTQSVTTALPPAVLKEVIQQQLAAAFWAAPEDAYFNQKVIAAVTGYSESWCERMRWAGGGIQYQKVGRKCLYRKRDVLEWLSQYQTVRSTSEYSV